MLCFLFYKNVNPYTYTGNTVICIPTAYYNSYNFGTSSSTVSCTYYTAKAGLYLKNVLIFFFNFH